MMNKSQTYLFLLFFLYNTLCSALNNEVSALLSIKESLVDPLNHLQDWKLSNINVDAKAHCDWTGILCNPVTRVVEELDLSHKNLSGRISDDIQNLQSHTSLNLCCNGFDSKLPKSAVNLTLLKKFDVSQNMFFDNFRVGLGKASGLVSFNASSNNFSGFLPDDIGNATSLEVLDLRGSYFQGTIPKNFKNLQKLKFLGLSGNNLTGQIPGELGELSSLESMILGYNEFIGDIPGEFGNLVNLKYLDLAVGNLGGSIPSELGRLTLLHTLFLFQNNFEGEIPPEISGITALSQLDLSDNMLSGEIPSGIAELKNLQLLNLMCNNFSGPVPSRLGWLTKLEVLELWNNSLSGALPSDLGKYSPLQWLDVSSNSLSGEIPTTLCNGGNLTKLILFNNALSGPIPIGLSSCFSLVRMRMQNNLITGIIPVGFGKLKKLLRLELANNSLTGQIPADISSSTSLSFIDFSRNRLQPSIPSTILTISNLQTFMASNNNLQGEIPDQFQDCPSLSVLDLSSNRLSGSIPENGVLKTINPNDLVGNAGLCGNVLPPCTKDPETATRQKGLHVKHIVAGWLIGIASLLSLGIALLGTRTLFKKWHENGSCFEEKFEMSNNGEWPWRLMAFQRLGFTTADILASIKESNVIGLGATGTVYKAEIPRSNEVVAVKKLWRSQTDIETGNNNSNELVGEINVLGRLRHRNIVCLLGFLHNDTNVMIVYEFMQNGSLGEALHAKEAAGRLLVDWVSRYNIAVGVAQGIAYLHHDCHPSIIHRDIKSNNILLDANLEARIADFGLARTMVRKNETVSMVAGSYGYIVPGKSYGVVLLELLTGKRPLDAEFGEAVDIVEWFRSKLRDNRDLEEALDPNIGNCKSVQEEMLLVLRIALLCTAKLPKDRPSMRDVITMLGGAKPRRKSNSNSTSIDKDKPIFSTSPVNGLL